MQETLGAAGKEPIRPGSELTKAGRALAKHNPQNRPGSAFPTPKGSPADISEQARQILRTILTSPDAKARAWSVRSSRDPKKFETILNVRLPDGTGARFRIRNKGQWIKILEKPDWEFVGFLERYQKTTHPGAP